MRHASDAKAAAVTAGPDLDRLSEPVETDARELILAAVAKLAARMLAVRDPREVMQPALEEFGEAIGSAQVMLHPFRRARDGYRRLPCTALYCAPGREARLLEQILYPVTCHALTQRCAEILEAGETCLWDELLDETTRTHLAGTDTHLPATSFPIFLHGELWGSLGVITADPTAVFTTGELDALGLAAGLFSAALARAEASEELDRLDAIMRAVARVATESLALGDPYETSRRLVVELAAATDRPIVSVCRAVPGAAMMEVVALHGDFDPTSATLEDRALFTQVIEEYRRGRHVVIRPDDLTPDQRAVVRKAGTMADSLLGTPIVVDGHLWGHVVVADEPDSRPYSDSEIDAIRIAAGLVVAAAKRQAAEVALRESESMLMQSQQLEAIGHLAGGVAHDFSNTLMAVRGFASLIEEGSHDAETQVFARHILEVTERSTVLLRRLLDLARDSGGDPVVARIGELLASLECLLAGALPRNIAIAIDVADDAPAVEIDPSVFEQIVLNLVLNARDAMPAGGRLAIAARAGESGQCEISVADTGTGMDAEVLARIFDPFFTTKDRTNGSGIGLTVVRGIVTRAGGTITARSEAGVGSTFVLTLPAATADAVATTPSAEAPSESPDLPARRERILLVEDDERLRTALSLLLARRGYDVVVARTSGEALRLIETGERFDLLLADVVLPHEDGRRLTQEARARQPGIAVLLMSAATRRPDDAALPQVGFVPKVEASSQLLKAIDDLLATPAGARERDGASGPPA